jgi:hypothetical protein
MTGANRLSLWCDDCDRSPLTLAASDELAAAEKAALRDLLLTMARRLGWRITSRWHQCPACHEGKVTCPRCHQPAGQDCTFGRCKEPAPGPETTPAAAPIADDGAWLLAERGER